MSDFDYAREKKRHRLLRLIFTLGVLGITLFNSRREEFNFDLIITLGFAGGIAFFIGHFLAKAIAMPFVPEKNRKVINIIQFAIGASAFIYGFIAFMIIDGTGLSASLVMGFIYGIIGIIIGSLIGRYFVSVKESGTYFPESESIGRINGFISIGFGVVALMSAYMFFVAMASDFSADSAHCIVRGGQTCLESLNPIWTAQTLGWLAPATLVVSILGIILMRKMKSFWPTSVIGIFLALILVSLALSQAIENPEEWTEGMSQLSTGSVSGILVNANQSYKHLTEL